MDQGTLPVTITKEATEQLLRIIEDNALHGQSLRLGVSGGGCSGFQYVLEFDDQVDLDKDVLYVQSPFNVVVDKKSQSLMQGIVLSFSNGLKDSGFKFSNPNATKVCGCGQSFNCS